MAGHRPGDRRAVALRQQHDRQQLQLRGGAAAALRQSFEEELQEQAMGIDLWRIGG